MIKNCSWNKHIAYTLEMLSSKDPMVPQKAAGASGVAPNDAAHIQDSTNPHMNAHPFFWSGPTFSTGYLEPLAEVEIVLLACFTQPGVYDINRWRLAVQVVKSQRKRKNAASKNQIKPDEGDGFEDVDLDDGASPSAAAAPQGIGKGFMQMPNLAHYIQVTSS